MIPKCQHGVFFEGPDKRECPDCELTALREKIKVAESGELDKESAFRKHNSWGLSFNELVALSFKKGCLELPNDKQHSMQNENTSDVVHISESGSMMTRYMANSWAKAWGSFSAGYDSALVARDVALTEKDARIAEKDIALRQASFCLRELLQDDADAKLTVKIINKALTSAEVPK